MTIKRQILVLGALGALSFSSAMAASKDYPSIYPFVPVDTNQIHESVQRMSEDKDALVNFYEIQKKRLSQGKTFKVDPSGTKRKAKPWTSTYWPLNRGLIADAYDDGFFGAYSPTRLFSWEHNRNRYLKRADSVHKNIDSLTNEELEKLAPSEKYDLLLGDKEFSLTNKIWNYMQSWGSMKEYGHLHSLDKVGGGALDRAAEMLNWGWYGNMEEATQAAISQRGGLAELFAGQMVEDGKFGSLEEAMPDAIDKAKSEQHNYVLSKKNDYMATWEGICHGWSTAAGIVPRPRRTVTFTLDDGRKLKFYPADIKGLIAYLWANSLIQDGRWYDNNGTPQGGGILMQGLRCNEKKPKKDEWGRYYDSKADFFSGKHEARCVGVHPAVWHLGLTNIIGNQGRSFIVERKIKAAVDNHPMYKYEMEYFNPYTGEYSTDLKAVVQTIRRDDQFFNFRNRSARYIVGVKTKMTYLDWARPRRAETDSEADDKEAEKEMLYDLELDQDGVIVGGQWRALESGKPSDAKNDDEYASNSQPDFFWVVTKDWKNWFQDLSDVEPWTNTKSAPPASWKERAQVAHNFMYNKTHAFGWNERCKIVHKVTGKIETVPCEYKESKPQPFVNLVTKLIELSQ